MASTKKAAKAKMVAKKRPSKPKKTNKKPSDGHIGFFITDSKNQTAELPIVPPEIMVNYETSDSTDNIIKLGEVNRVGKRKLRKIEVESFIPWYVENSRLVTARTLYGRTRDYIAFFKAIQDSEKPVRVVISQTTITMKGTLQLLDYGFKEGNGEEYHYKLTFVEQKASKAKKSSKAKKIVRKSKNGKSTTIKGTVKKGKQRSPLSYKFNRGSNVYVSGESWTKPNVKNDMAGHYNHYPAIVGSIKPSAKMPYQIRSRWGGHMGWVKKSSLTPR